MRTILQAWIVAAVTALVALPALASEGGDNNDPEPPEVERFGAVVLTISNGRRFRPKRLRVSTAVEPVELPLPNRVEVRDENRINLRGVPVIGKVFEPTSSFEFRGALPVGGVFVDGESLVVGTPEAVRTNVLVDGVRLVVIANRDVSFRIPIDFARQGTPALGDLPAVGGLFRAGEALRTRDALILLVEPTMVDPDR